MRLMSTNELFVWFLKYIEEAFFLEFFQINDYVKLQNNIRGVFEMFLFYKNFSSINICNNHCKKTL